MLDFKFYKYLISNIDYYLSNNQHSYLTTDSSIHDDIFKNIKLLKYEQIGKSKLFDKSLINKRLSEVKPIDFFDHLDTLNRLDIELLDNLQYVNTPQTLIIYYRENLNQVIISLNEFKLYKRNHIKSISIAFLKHSIIKPLNNFIEKYGYGINIIDFNSYCLPIPNHIDIFKKEIESINTNKKNTLHFRDLIKESFLDSDQYNRLIKSLQKKEHTLNKPILNEDMKWNYSAVQSLKLYQILKDHKILKPEITLSQAKQTLVNTFDINYKAISQKTPNDIGITGEAPELHKKLEHYVNKIFLNK